MSIQIKETIFREHFIDNINAGVLCQKLELERKHFTQLTKEINIERKEEILEMKRIRQLFNNKRKDKKTFKFSDKFSEFYKWYLNQYQI